MAKPVQPPLPFPGEFTPEQEAEAIKALSELTPEQLQVISDAFQKAKELADCE